MNGRTHIIWAIAAAIAFALIITYPCGFTLPLFLFAAIIGGLAPDLDHPKSMLGKKVKVLNYGAKHRGFMHSIWAVVLLTLILYKMLPNWHTEVFAFAIGYLSHLLLDTMTPSGINWFYPWGRLKGPIASDGWFAFVIQILGIIAVIVFATLYFQVSFAL